MNTIIEEKTYRLIEKQHKEHEKGSIPIDKPRMLSMIYAIKITKSTILEEIKKIDMSSLDDWTLIFEIEKLLED